MLLAFAGNWDATAVGTLTLAVVTGVSLVFGWTSLRQSQKEVEEAHRPVVIPVTFARHSVIAVSVSRSRGTAPAYPCLVEERVLGVPIKNIGPGPALNVEASIKRLNEDGSVWE